MEISLPLSIGVIAGINAGLLGIGGGAILVPALVILIGVDQQAAQGVSLATIIVTSLAGTVTNWRSGSVDWRLVLAMVPPAILCAIGASVAANALPAQVLQRIFAILLVILGVQRLWSSRQTADLAVPYVE